MSSDRGVWCLCACFRFTFFTSSTSIVSVSVESVVSSQLTLPFERRILGVQKREKNTYSLNVEKPVA
jgi:hypothetical protein